MAQSELTAAVNGEFVPVADAQVPITDAGYRWGYSVFESLRTFDHEPTFLEDYLSRIERSARRMQIDVPSRETLRDGVNATLDANHDVLEDDGDVRLQLFISGVLPWEEGVAEQSVVMIPVRIAFESYARRIVAGERHSTSRIRHVPPQSLPATVKSSSRLHFRLADLDVIRDDPEAETLLLDTEGNVAELTTANLFIVSDGELVTPPTRNALPGITREKVMTLAAERLDVTVSEREFQLADVYDADEVFYTATSRVMVPITEVDGFEIGDGTPGSLVYRLFDEFGEFVGIDVLEQYLSHLPPDERP